MRWYEIAAIALLIPVGYYLRDIAYSSQRKPNRLQGDIAHLWQILKGWGRRAAGRNHKDKRQ